MQDVLLLLLGAGAGGGAVWLFMSQRTREALRSGLAEAARRGVRAVELAKDESAAQLERREQEVAALRAALEEERSAAEEIRSRLKADLALALRERGQIEARTTELDERADDLSAQLRAATDESRRDLERLRDIARSLERILENMETRLSAAAGRVKEPARPGRPLSRPR